MKKSLTFHYIILLMLCQVAINFGSVSAISEPQKTAISTKCDSIKTSLKAIQKNDASARVFLGRYYDIILNKFITPLNVRLVENNLSTANFVENQNDFADAKTVFSNDYIKYQQLLEELVLINCQDEPEKFYNQLISVREKRKTMEQDILKIRNLLSVHIKLVNNLKAKL